MESDKIYYGQDKLIRALNKYTEVFLSEENRFMKLDDSYTLTMEFTRNEAKLQILETSRNRQAITSLEQKVANLERKAAINDAKLRDMNRYVAELESKKMANEREIWTLNKHFAESSKQLRECQEESANLESTLKEQISELESDFLTSLKQLKDNSIGITDLKSREKRYQEEISTLNRDISKKSEKLECRILENRNLRLEIGTILKKVDELEMRIWGDKWFSYLFGSIIILTIYICVSFNSYLNSK